jgi:hypothetical protein
MAMIANFHRHSNLCSEAGGTQFPPPTSWTSGNGAGTMTALRHQFVRRDGLLRRMILGR